MAETRATGKAYRQGLSFLALLANLDPCSAEEIQRGATNFGKQNASTGSTSEPIDLDEPLGFGKKHKDTKRRDVPPDYLEWMVSDCKNAKWRKVAENIIIARKAERDERAGAGQSETARGSSPELLIFTRQTDSKIMADLLGVRYEAKHLDELDTDQQEDLLAWFQEEYRVRPLYIKVGTEFGVKVMEAHFPLESYRTLSGEKMKDFGKLLEQHQRIKNAKESTEAHHVNTVIAGWSDTKNIELPAASYEELEDLLNHLNGMAK